MDRDIRAAVYEELVTDPRIDADGIVVDIFGGDITLNGTVPSQAQRSEAARRRGGWLAGPRCRICWRSHCSPMTTGTTRPWRSW